MEKNSNIGICFLLDSVASRVKSEPSFNTTWGREAVSLLDIDAGVLSAEPSTIQSKDKPAAIARTKNDLSFFAANENIEELLP